MDPRSKATEKVVSIIADKLLSGTWLRITKGIREEKRAHEAAAARETRLRGALGILAEGLAFDQRHPDASIKIAQAVNELQTEGPTDVDEDLDHLVAYVTRAVEKDHVQLTQAEIYELTKPIREKVGPMLGKRG